MSMLKTETDIHTDEVIHRARAPTVALAKNIDHEMIWNTLDRGKPFSPVSILRNLYTKEKYFIIF